MVYGGGAGLSAGVSGETDSAGAPENPALCHRERARGILPLNGERQASHHFLCASAPGTHAAQVDEEAKIGERQQRE